LIETILLDQAAPRPGEVDCKIHETLAFQDLDTKKTCETHNLYIKHPWKPQEYYFIQYLITIIRSFFSVI